jgi:hypothetical protein
MLASRAPLREGTGRCIVDESALVKWNPSRLVAAAATTVNSHRELLWSRRRNFAIRYLLSAF